MTDPHRLSRRPLSLSVLALLVLLLDFLLGYWFVIRPLLAGWGLVVFDRYYDDLLVDPNATAMEDRDGLPNSLAVSHPQAGPDSHPGCSGTSHALASKKFH